MSTSGDNVYAATYFAYLGSYAPVNTYREENARNIVNYIARD